MDSSETCLDGIEAQRTIDVSHDQRKGICFHMNLLCKRARSLICSRGFSQSREDGARQTRHTKPLPAWSELYRIPGETVAMNSKILCAMRAGNIEYFDNMKNLETPMACFKNNKGDSVLHIAATFGHHELVNSIVFNCPSLLLEPNSNGQIPLHVAARAGQSKVVKSLIAWITSFSDRLAEENRERLNPYVLKDQNGDTPLHLALIAPYFLYHPFRRPEYFESPPKCSGSDYTHPFYVAYKNLSETPACLVNADKHASFLANKKGVSPLYLAVEARKVSLVREMLNHPGKNVQENSSDIPSPFLQLEGRKSLVHAALKSKSTDVLDIILTKFPSLVNERDEEGRTCLSVAASEGFYEGLCMLLDRTSLDIFESDDDGSFPIHRVVEKGHESVCVVKSHEDVFKELLKRYPDSVEQLNKKGQNIFHIAATSGRARLFLQFYINKVDREKYLMEQDMDGNTPLHLATKYWRPKTLYTLMKSYSTKTKVLNIRNNDDLRPLDIAQNNLHSEYVFRERMTMMVLLGAYEVAGLFWIPTCGITLKSKSDNVIGGGKYKYIVEVLLVVTTLVATVTFAAGFTIPGGFNSSDPKAGMAILVDDKNLTKFLLFDAIAMYSSIVAIVALIWVQLGDQKLAERAFNVALPSLFISLTFLSSAFYFGVYATVKHNGMLRHTLLAAFAMSSSVTTLLLTPYVIPQTFGITIVKSITDSYLFVILALFVNEDDDKLMKKVETVKEKEVQKPNQSSIEHNRNSASQKPIETHKSLDSSIHP